MTTETTKTFDIPALLAELDAAELEFNSHGVLVEKAAAFLRLQKGRLNEHQFVQKLEAASTDPARAKSVIEQQHRMRCSYMSGRLALMCATNQLHAGLRSRDKLVRTVMKLVATIPHIRDANDRDLLTVCAFEAARRSNIALDHIREKREREQHNDLTNGRGVESVKHLYEQLIATGFSGMEQDALRQTTVVEMVLIPLAGADLREYRFAGREANDALVDVANAAITLLLSEEFRKPWTCYNNNKSRLNEPQYANRLQQMLTATPPNAAGVEVIKNEQRYTRIEFLSTRVAVTAQYHRLRAMASSIDAAIVALKTYIAEENTGGPNQKLVAMNNVIAAAAVSTKIKRMVERWETELRETDDNRETASASLVEAFNELIAQGPYNGLRWSCSGPGSYVEPL